VASEVQERAKEHAAASGESGMKLGVAALAMLALAACLWMKPDPSGCGTHTHLGMRPCAHLERYGIPCAACGATTSVCWLVRGEVANAFQTHCTGALIGLIILLSIPFSILSAAMGWRWAPRLNRMGVAGWTLAACAFAALMLVGWPGRIERYLDWQEAHQQHVVVAGSVHADGGGLASNPDGLRP